MGGQRGLEPPPSHFEGWGAEPPHFLNVYTFQYALHKKKSLKTTIRRPQKHSPRVENSKISWGMLPHAGKFGIIY